MDLPISFDDLDNVASEFINHLYQDDRPLSWASDFCCGIKRLYPQCRRKLDGICAPLLVGCIATLGWVIWGHVSHSKGDVPCIPACIPSGVYVRVAKRAPWPGLYRRGYRVRAVTLVPGRRGVLVGF